MRRYGACLLFLFAASALAADRPDWPVAPVAPPDVIPNPMPIPANTLNGSDWYVVQSDEDVQLLASPPGVVTVVQEAGPIRLRGTFADGGGKVETRTYQKKHVFVVERLQAGQVELLVVPKGKTERRVIGDGTDPIPPPKPKPEPKPDPVTKSFRVIFVIESGAALTAAQSSVVYGVAVEEFLTAKCTGGRAGWLRRDKDATVDRSSEVMKALWAAVKPSLTGVPSVVIEKNGHAEILPLEATPAAQIAKFKTYLSEK